MYKKKDNDILCKKNYIDILVAPIRPAIPVFCPLTLGLTATSVPRIPANKKHQMKTNQLAPYAPHVKIWINWGICSTCLCWNRVVYVLLLSPGSNTCNSRSCETWSQLADWAEYIFVFGRSFTSPLHTCPPARPCHGPRPPTTEVPNSGMETSEGI